MVANDNGAQSPLFASPANASYCSSLGTPYPPISPAPALIPSFPDGSCAPHMSPGNMTLLYRLPHPLSAVLPLLPSFSSSVPATAGELNVASTSVSLNGSDSAPGTARRYTGDGGDAEGNYFVDTLTEWQAPRHGDAGANQAPLVVIYSVAPMSLNVSALVSATSPASSLTGLDASGNPTSSSSTGGGGGGGGGGGDDGGGGIGAAAIAAAGGASAASALLANADTSARPDPYRPFPDEPIIGVYAGAHALVIAPDCQSAHNSLWNYTVRFCATNAPTAARWFRERSLRGVRSIGEKLGGDGGDAAVLDEKMGTGCEASRTTATGAGSQGASGSGSNTSVAIPGPTGRETGAASNKAYSARMSMGAAVTLAVAGSIAFAAMMV